MNQGSYKWNIVGVLPESHRPEVPESFHFMNGRGFMVMADGRILTLHYVPPVVPDIKYGEHKWGAFA